MVELLEAYREAAVVIVYGDCIMPCFCNSFRCAVESLDLAHHQNRHSECELSELACSHADMSRLTYVSEQENTFPVPAADESSEDHKVGATWTVSLVRLQGQKC